MLFRSDVLMLAADGAYGDKGIVQIAPKLGLSDEQISRLLWLSEPEWCAAKTRLIETNRIMLGDGNTLHIVNWTKYQSEYDRQKPQRQSKSSKGKKKKKRGGAG